jgi:hypothetical protein
MMDNGWWLMAGGWWMGDNGFAVRLIVAGLRQYVIQQTHHP